MNKREYQSCDFCGEEAIYDSHTRIGPWAFLCEKHFQALGTGLGVGRGSRLDQLNKEEVKDDD